jgi:hypothetical protein
VGDDRLTEYYRGVAYEMWVRGNLRTRAVDPALPPDPNNPYSNLEIIEEGVPVAHAVAAGSGRPDCGAERIVPCEVPWSRPLPETWVRCPICIGLHPL